MIFVLLFVVLAIIIYFKIRPYIIKHDTIALYTGGGGSGKTYFSVKDVCKLYRKQKIKVFFKNIKHALKRDKIKEKVVVYSNMPIIKKGLFGFNSVELTDDILLGVKRIELNSIVFIDEINLYISQFELKNPNLRFLELFISLYRHITKGGYIVANTQNVNKVHHIFRYCANESYNLHGFTKITPFFYYTRCRRISLGDDIKNVSTETLEQGERIIWSINNPFRRKYDTYAHSEVIASAPFATLKKHIKLKSEKLLKIHKERQNSHFDEKYL